jgi:tetratricopeptide (TPR) repeat protein
LLLDNAYNATSANARQEHLRTASHFVSKAEALSPRDSNFWVAKSILMLVEQQYPMARGLLDARLDLSKHDEFALMVKGCLELQEEKYLEAAKTYQTILKENPSCPPSVRLGIGICAYNLGHLDVAIDAFRRNVEMVLL